MIIFCELDPINYSQFKLVDKELEALKVSHDTLSKAHGELRKELDQYKEGFESWLKSGGKQNGKEKIK